MEFNFRSSIKPSPALTFVTIWHGRVPVNAMHASQFACPLLVHPQDLMVMMIFTGNTKKPFALQCNNHLFKTVIAILNCANGWQKLCRSAIRGAYFRFVGECCCCCCCCRPFAGGTKIACTGQPEYSQCSRTGLCWMYFVLVPRTNRIYG